VSSGLANPPPSYHQQQNWNTTPRTNPAEHSLGFDCSSGSGANSGWGPIKIPPNNSRQNVANAGGQSSWQKASSSSVSAQACYSAQSSHDNRQSMAGSSSSVMLPNYSPNVPPPKVQHSPYIPPPKRTNSPNQEIFQQNTNLKQNFLDRPPPGAWNTPKGDLQQNPTRMTSSTTAYPIPPPSFVTSQQIEGNIQRQTNDSNLPLVPELLLDKRGMYEKY